MLSTSTVRKLPEVVEFRKSAALAVNE